MLPIFKSVQCNLAKGRIGVLPPPAAANAFVCRVLWAGTFARGGRRTMHNELMRRYVTVGWHMSPQMCPFPWGMWTLI